MWEDETIWDSSSGRKRTGEGDSWFGSMLSLWVSTADAKLVLDAMEELRDRGGGEGSTGTGFTRSGRVLGPEGLKV